MKLEALLARASVEDIVLNPRGIAFHEAGRWQGPFPSPDCEAPALQSLARHLAERACTTLGLTQPSVDAFLPLHGATFRAHAVIPPLVMEGPEITLRRLPERDRFGLDDFEMPEGECERLRAAVIAGHSILVAGATGSGKTSLLSALMGELPQNERVLVLEDSPELPLPNALSSRLVARTDRFGFRSGATWELGHLVFESLRMRPDRLVLGECRGGESAAIASALMTGHAGIMTTLHAGSTAQALERFAQLSGRSDAEEAWDLVVHIKNASGGRRVISELRERGTPAGRA